jgi:hypothetical protein
VDTLSVRPPVDSAIGWLLTPFTGDGQQFADSSLDADIPVE